MMPSGGAVATPTPDGRAIGVEIKAGATVRTGDLTGLRNLAQKLDAKFVAGYVLYMANRPCHSGPGTGGPMDALWRLTP